MFCGLLSQCTACGLQSQAPYISSTLLDEHGLFYTMTPYVVYLLYLQDAICRCLIDIAAGMDYLHSLGVLHGVQHSPSFTCVARDFGGDVLHSLYACPPVPQMLLLTVDLALFR